MKSTISDAFHHANIWLPPGEAFVLILESGLTFVVVSVTR